MTESFSASWVSDTVIRLDGRFDASQAAKAEKALASAEGCVDVDFTGLIYISSAGIGCLLATHKRLKESDGFLRLVNLNDHVLELFELAGFDTVFEMG